MQAHNLTNCYLIGEDDLNNFRKVFVIFCICLAASLYFNFTCLAADTGGYEEIMPQKESVSIDKVWHITFSSKLKKNTVNSNNIIVLDSKQQHVPIIVRCEQDNKSVDVSPVNNYDSGKTYSLIITNNVQTIYGKTMKKSERMKFSTQDQSTSAFKVCIDAGYGGKDGGQTGSAGGKESSVNLSVALKTGKILQDRGIQVFYTRTSDVNIDLLARFKIANDNNVNCFVSIHCNASKNKSAAGIETYYYDENSSGKKIASLIQTELIKSTGSIDRGAKPGQYAEVKSTDAMGVKIYLGFMTSPSQEKLLCSEDFESKSAAAIADGIIDYYNDQFSNGSDDVQKINPESNDIVAYAYKFLGTSYLFGGTSPVSGFDCSGFVQYVYSHFGIKLSRDTYGQIKQGTAVNKDELAPGDLIFFGTDDNPSHVAIYAGNNFIIHAPHTGETVKVSSLDDMKDYLCAKRILSCSTSIEQQ